MDTLGEHDGGHERGHEGGHGCGQSGAQTRACIANSATFKLKFCWLWHTVWNWSLLSHVPLSWGLVGGRLPGSDCTVVNPQVFSYKGHKLGMLSFWSLLGFSCGPKVRRTAGVKWGMNTGMSSEQKKVSIFVSLHLSSDNDWVQDIQDGYYVKLFWDVLVQALRLWHSLQNQDTPSRHPPYESHKLGSFSF